MPPLREVKNRIKSVKNISQITRALEAVSASRVRKAQARTLASRAFAEKAWEILLNVQNAISGAAPHPLLLERENVRRVMVVVVTSDRGLAGSYNTNVLRAADRYARRSGVEVEYITIGRKGRDSLLRTGANIVAEFSDFPAEPTLRDISPIARLATDAFLSGEVDEVLIAYTDFVNMLAQRPIILGWLPLTPGSSAERVAQEYVKDVPQVSSTGNYEYEPSAAAVLEEIVPRFTELQLYQAVLESVASEHAARMAAMRNATDNASQLVQDLTLEYNKARQAAITSEILDIVGGANALQQAIDSAVDDIMKAVGNTFSPDVVPANYPLVDEHEDGRETRTDIDHIEAADVPDDEAAPDDGNALSAAKVVEQNMLADDDDSSDDDSSDDDMAEGNVGGSTADGGERDNLRRVEGIGPKIQRALNENGIRTFAQLAQAQDETLRAAIEAAGIRLAPSLSTWSQQAQFAADGDWDGLRNFQDTLNAGRKSD